MRHLGTLPREFFPGMHKFNLVMRKHQEIQIQGPPAMCLTSALQKGQDHKRQGEAEGLSQTRGN